MLTVPEILVPVVDMALPLVLFLTAAIWLAAFAERAGVADELARRLWRAASGRPARLVGLTCLLCAALTATVSLDGAVVLMVPVVLVLAQRAPDLRRPLLLGTIGAANAFSLALPQGNPANLAVIEQLELPPTRFVGHLFFPALLATLIATAAVALTERRALWGREATGAEDRSESRRSPTAPLAVAALLSAANRGARPPRR